MATIVTPPNIFLSGLQAKDEEQKRVEAEAAARRASEQANAINPLNVVADAIGRFFVSGGNPLAAATAFINPIKGQDVNIGKVATNVAGTAAGANILGDAGSVAAQKSGDLLGSIGQQVGRMANPENIGKSAVFLESLKGPEEATAAASKYRMVEATLAKTTQDTETHKAAMLKSGAEVGKLNAEAAQVSATTKATPKLQTYSSEIQEAVSANSLAELDKISNKIGFDTDVVSSVAISKELRKAIEEGRKEIRKNVRDDELLNVSKDTLALAREKAKTDAQIKREQIAAKKKQDSMDTLARGSKKKLSDSTLSAQGKKYAVQIGATAPSSLSANLIRQTIALSELPDEEKAYLLDKVNNRFKEN